MFKEISRSLRKKFNAIRPDVMKFRFKTSSKLGKKELEEGLKKLDDTLIYPCLNLTPKQKEEYLLLAKKMSQPKEKQDVPITLSLDTSFNNWQLMKNNKQEDSSTDTESLSTMSDLSLETSQNDTTIETPTKNNLSLFGASFGNLHQQFKPNLPHKEKPLSLPFDITENKPEVCDEALRILKHLNKVTKSHDAETQEIIDSSLKPDLKKLFQTVKDNKAQRILESLT